jgi:anaerobic selenocysteine-containing dehydrogenase
VPREELSYCRICAAACGIVVTVEGGRVVRVRGDDEHPVSRGYVCSKARGIAAWHHSPRCLDRPRLHGRDVTWDELLSDLATRLGGSIDSHGQEERLPIDGSHWAAAICAAASYATPVAR